MNRTGESVRTVTAGNGGPGEDRRLVLRDRSLEVGRRTLIMGILNVTPDSFYDGGRHNGTGKALEAAARMSEEGADIIDVGGESTRPGAETVSPEEEWRRVGPVIGSLVDAGMTVSVDTWKSETARKALEAGAHLVNDISGGTLDPDLQRTVASFDAGLVVMHIQGVPGTMQADPSYTDLMGEILDFLSRQARAAIEAGVSHRSLMIDPGIGFGKRPGDNLEILARTRLL
jgi:dihydropteroate synthase